MAKSAGLRKIIIRKESLSRAEPWRGTRPNRTGISPSRTGISPSRTGIRRLGLESVKQVCRLRIEGIRFLRTQLGYMGAGIIPAQPSRRDFERRIGMGFLATTGCVSMCSMGMIPVPLTFINPMVLGGGALPSGCILDMVPYMNIPPFGLCRSLLNPITAALSWWGGLTPGPCIFAPLGTWLPIKPNIVGSVAPVLTSDCKLMCAFAGCIQINIPSQFTVLT